MYDDRLTAVLALLPNLLRREITRAVEAAGAALVVVVEVEALFICELL